MITFLTVLLVSALLALAGVIFWFFGRYWLARRNLFWTIVDEGTTKQVVYQGGFYKSLLQKTGHRFDEDWNIIPLGPDEEEVSTDGGLRWVGIYPFFKVYEGKMIFVKSMGEQYEKRSEEGVDFMLAMDYVYALLFEKAEDKNSLPLSGHMAMTAMITNPRKALFLVKYWYDALVGAVLPLVREFISENEYEGILRDPNVHLDRDVFRALNDKGTSGRSIIELLREDYGIALLGLKTINIDPPEENRKLTMAIYKADQEARAEAISTSGALERMINSELEALARRLGFVKAGTKVGITEIDKDVLKKYLLDNKEVLPEIRQQMMNLLLRERAGQTGGLKHIVLSDADGNPLNTQGNFLGALMGLGGGTTTPAPNGKDADPTGSAVGGSSGTIKPTGPKGKTPLDPEVQAILDEKKKREKGL